MDKCPLGWLKSKWDNIGDVQLFLGFTIIWFLLLQLEQALFLFMSSELSSMHSNFDNGWFPDK